MALGRRNTVTFQLNCSRWKKKNPVTGGLPMALGRTSTETCRQTQPLWRITPQVWWWPRLQYYPPVTSATNPDNLTYIPMNTPVLQQPYAQLRKNRPELIQKYHTEATWKQIRCLVVFQQPWGFLLAIHAGTRRTQNDMQVINPLQQLETQPEKSHTVVNDRKNCM